VAVIFTVLPVIMISAQNPRPLPTTPPPNASQQQLPPGTASVSGIVVATGTNEPVPNASLELRRLDCNNFANPPELLTATSGPDGKFVFKNVRAGGWCIVATMAGGKYTPAEYLQRGVLGRGVTIPVADGQTVTGIQLAMAPTGGIAGRVQDRDGEPLAFTRVQILEPFYQDGQRRLYILQVAQTDDRGEYRFYWLPPGQYYVAAVREDTRRRQVVSVRPPPGTGGHREDTAPAVVTRRIQPDGKVIEETYLMVYYPGDPDTQRALPVAVQPGLTTSGIDISFASGTVKSFHVRGNALNGMTGKPAEGAQIRIAPCEWAATVIMPAANADANGNFDITGVTPGCHMLYANTTMANPAAPAAPPTPVPPGPGAAAPANAPPINLAARVPLEISADANNLQLVLATGITVTGQVVVDDPSVTTIPRGMSVSIAREPDIVGLPLSQSRGVVQPDGSFTLPNVGPGDYRIYVSPFLNTFQWGPPPVPQQLQNMYVKSVQIGGSDLLTDGLHVQGAATGSIRVLLGAGGRLQGQANDEKRQALPNVTVALIPDLNLRGHPALYRSTSTDISGRFQFAGIPPGRYKVFAWEVIERDIWQNLEFIRTIEDRGTAVEIREGVQATADVVTISPARR